MYLKQYRPKKEHFKSLKKQKNLQTQLLKTQQQTTVMTVKTRSRVKG